MREPGEQRSVVYSDILEQASSLPRTVAALKDLEAPDTVWRERGHTVFTGCGSSYYAARCAAQLANALGGIRAHAVPASEVWLLPELWLREGTVLVAISRTGTTTEVVRAVERARDFGVPTVGVSLGEAEVPLRQLAALEVGLPHVREAGRPMTQSFSNMLLAAQWLAAEVGRSRGNPQGAPYQDGLEGAAGSIGSLLPDLEGQAVEAVEDGVGHYAFLGSGPLTGLCDEAALKVKEMSRVEAESYSTMEFRHGPIAALREDSTVFLASCGRTVGFDALVAKDVAFLGGTAVITGPEGIAGSAPDGARFVGLPDGLPDWVYGNLALPFFQFVAYHQTLRLGFDPNSVRHLDKKVDPHIDPHVVDVGPTVGG